MLFIPSEFMWTRISLYAYKSSAEVCEKPYTKNHTQKTMTMSRRLLQYVSDINAVYVLNSRRSSHTVPFKIFNFNVIFLLVYSTEKRKKKWKKSILNVLQQFHFYAFNKLNQTQFRQTESNCNTTSPRGNRSI